MVPYFFFTQPPLYLITQVVDCFGSVISLDDVGLDAIEAALVFADSSPGI